MAATRWKDLTVPHSAPWPNPNPNPNKVEGSHRASLGTLAFKASTDLAGFKDATIADRPKDSLIVVNCGLGGQAKLGAAMLVDYGFTNVKVQTP